MNGTERIEATTQNVEFIEKNRDQLDTFEYLVYLDTREHFLSACDTHDEDLAIKYAVLIDLFAKKIMKQIEKTLNTFFSGKRGER